MKKFTNLSSYCGEIVDNELWISESKFNGLFRVNLTNFSATAICRFKNKKAYSNIIHKKSCVYGKYIYFFDNLGDGYSKVDTDDGSVKEVSLLNYSNGRPFSITDIKYVDCNTVILVPIFANQDLLIMNLQTEEISILSRYTILLKPYIKNINDGIFEIAAFINEKLYIPIIDTPYIVVTDIKDGFTEIINTGEGNLFTICSFNGGIALTKTNSTELIFMDMDFNVIKKISITDGINSYQPFCSMIDLNDRLLVLPCDSEKNIFSIDKNFTVNIIATPYNFQFNDLSNIFSFKCKFYGYIKYNKLIYLLPSDGNMLLIYNTDRMVLEGEKIDIPDIIQNETYPKQYIGDRYLDEIKNNKYLYEDGGLFTLEYFTETLKNDEIIVESSNRKSLEVGKKIWKLCK